MLLTQDEALRPTAFTAGLLHDVGRMAMAQADPIKYSRIVQMARSGIDPFETEELGFGKSHAAYGVEAAEVWALPEEVITVIGNHHEGRATDLSRAVWNARRIAAALGIGDGVVAARLPDDGEVTSANLPPDDRALLKRMGGGEAVIKQIDWYSGAISGATRAA
ncbi:MAG: HDOD domain-containing protein [Chloroflexi bacterium]|nr:HDOD domain-containing protein [Chloroflexota bacterium]